MWYLIIGVIVFLAKKNKEKKLMSSIDVLSSYVDENILSGDQQAALARKSGQNTLRYFIYSAITYLLVFSISFLYLYNQ